MLGLDCCSMLTLKQFHSQLAEGMLAGARHIRIRDALTEFPQALYAMADSLEILGVTSLGLRP